MFPHPEKDRRWEHVYPVTVNDTYPALSAKFRPNTYNGDWLLGIAVQYAVTGFIVTGLPEFEAPIDLVNGIWIPMLTRFPPDRQYTLSGTASGGAVGTTAVIVTFLVGR